MWDLNRSLKVISLAVITLIAVMSVMPVWAQVDSVNTLRQQGWQVVERTERQESVPGEAPYTNLKKIIIHTTYILEKGDQRYRCEIDYDSQRDKTSESCKAIN